MDVKLVRRRGAKGADELGRRTSCEHYKYFVLDALRHLQRVMSVMSLRGSPPAWPITAPPLRHCRLYAGMTIDHDVAVLSSVDHTIEIHREALAFQIGNINSPPPVF